MKQLIKLETKKWFPVALGIVGIIVSFTVLFSTTGSNDIRTWEYFATSIQTSGLFELYSTTRAFNVTPLMGIYGWLSLEVASLLGIQFSIVFKLLPVLANIASAILLWHMWREKADQRAAAWAFALYSWSFSSILVAAYHGQTDCMCAFLCLLTLYYLNRGKPALAGLALALAINVKIIPVLLVFPILATFRSFREVWLFCLYASIGAIPFLVTWVGAGMAFINNVFGYGSIPEMWGIRVLLYQLAALPSISPLMYDQIVIAYNFFGKTLLVQSILLLSVYGYWRRMDASSLLACGLALFLLLAPGFGVQYVVYVVPLMFAISLGWGFTYATISGLFIGLVYAHFQINASPFESFHSTLIPIQRAMIGFAAWWTILCFFAITLWKGHSGKEKNLEKQCK